MTRIDYEKLVEYLNKCRDAYYNDSHPLISDAEYDDLFDQVAKYEQETGFVLAVSPTQAIGYEVKSKLAKVEHPIPLRSLDKTKDIGRIMQFMGDKDCLRMLKYDGLTVELDEEAEIVYSIVFYDKDKTFISAVTDQAVDFDGTIPENAEFAKVVIHHATDAEYEFNLFNRRGFAKQLTITVNKD